MLINKILTVPLDWTLKQPIEVSIPENSEILSIKYFDNYDHLFFIGNQYNPKVVRKFLCKMTHDVVEETSVYELKYIATTIDEDNKAWHIFEVFDLKPKTSHRNNKNKNQ